MFQRVPSISSFAVAAAALIFLLAVLFASSLSSPGAAHAEHSSPPEVRIKAVMPEVGEEGSQVTVTLKLSRQLTEDEQYCYSGATSDGSTGEVCIEGGIIFWDSYNDHLPEEQNDNGNPQSEDWIKFVFRGSEVEKRITVGIVDDKCITPGRELRFEVNEVFLDKPGETEYGYTINTREFTVPVNGDDTTNGTDCASVPDGTTEEADYNKAPTFDDSQSPTFSVDENTGAGQDVGSPVSASDPENDTLTYSLQGQGAQSFSIDSSNGQIKTKDPLDHETKDTYHVAVFVRDSKNINGNSDTVDDNSIDVTINVDDVNEPPEFDSNAPTELNVLENTPAGENIGSPLTATDPDNTSANPNKDTLTYTLDDGDGATFGIDSSGQITTKDPLDKETKDSYSVTITARDSGGEDDTHTVTITVTDEEHEPPRFDEEYADGETSITREVAENTAAGEPVGAPVSATDDDGDTLTFSLDDQDGANFEIDANSQIKTKEALNFEEKDTYTVTVSVHDGKDINGDAEDPAEVDATIDVTIDVTDVNEGPAFADDAPATQEVAENTAAETDIGSAYTAIDPENDSPLTYSLGGADAAWFAIDTTTGQLKTKGDLDFEGGKTSYSVDVQVSDGKDAVGTAEDPPVVDTIHAVTITVTDVDDPGSIALSSQEPIVGSAITATLEDDDGGVTGETWVWESSTDQSNWNIISGADTNTYTPEAGDVGNYLQVTVSYTDGDGSGKTAYEETSSAVALRPATNEHPEFDDATTTRTVPENTIVDTNIGVPVSATHPDSKGTLVYSLDTTGATTFDIDSSTGQLKTKAELDYEGTPSYTVTVSVHDGLDNYENPDTTVDGSIEVAITVTNVNEPPAFADSSPTALELPENTANDQIIVGVFTATDPEGDDIEYIRTIFDDSEAFGFDQTTRQLKTKDALDFEAKSSYKVLVEARDNKAADGSADTNSDHVFREVTVTVTDVDEDGSITFSSDPPSAGTTLTATLADDDGVKTDVDATWVWESSTDQSTWTTITDADTDSITLGTEDIGNFYRVTATYDDEKGTGKTATGQTTAAVTAAPVTNEHPSFADATVDRSVEENTPAGQNIGAPVAATHSDSVGTLVYSLDTTGATSFDIDESTGQIKTKTGVDLDHETRASYTVTVSVSDGMDDYSNTDTAEDDSIEVTISVTNIDVPGDPDQPTVTAAPGAAAKLNVNWTAVTATPSAPVDGYDVQYREKDANPVADWTEVAVSTNSATITGLAYSTTYEVQVRSKNSEGESVWSPSGEANIPPLLNVAFSQGSYSVTEGSGATITVTVSPAADRTLSIPVTLSSSNAESEDYSPTSTTVSFASGDTSKTFTISTTNDSDRSDETVNLGFGTLPAAVGTGSQSTATLTIDDTTPAPNSGGGGGSYSPPLANAAPQFPSASTERSVAENTAADTDIGAPVSATDSNGDTLVYTLGGANGSSFDIDSSTGQLKTKAALDFEGGTTSYTVTVSVHDGLDDNGNPGTAEDDTITVTITVTDVDEDGTITFSSDPPSAGTALTATLSDDDAPISGETWSWEISDDGQSNWTSISGADTSSFTPQEADIGKYLRVTVTYTDSFAGNKSANAETGAIANRPPTNEHPSFADATADRSVEENTPAGQNIGAPVAATHSDSVGTLVYSLDTTGATNFDIDDSTGQLKSKAALDFETTQSYTVTVSVSDGMDDYSNADTVVDDSIDVTISVTDIDVPAVPAAPTVAAANGAAAKLNVTWTAVPATTTAPVDGYDVQYREKDANPIDDWTEMSVTTNSATITTGLEYSTTYEVQVRSKNSEGQSEWSASGEERIPSSLSVSFSPSSRTVDEGSPASFTVNVSPAADRALSIPVSITAGSAESDDFSPTSRTVSIASGGSSGTFSISTTNDSDRDNETVSIRFGTLPPAVGTGSQSTATLTINDTTPEPRNNNPGNNGGNTGGTTTKRPSSNFIPSNTPPANKVPEFSAGARTSREIPEKTPEGTNIGDPIAATDADQDNLTYSLGGTDASSFSIDTSDGQLKTKAELDFEIRDTYSVTVSVSDGKGGTDSIAVTIRVTDVVEVPVTDEDHQVVVLIDPDDETEVDNPDGDVTVTFPEDSRTGPFFVRIDSNPDNCDWDSLDDPPADKLRACVTIEVFDTQGNPIEGDDILDPSITVEVVVDKDDVGNDTILVFTESDGGWTGVTFTLTTDSDGNTIVTIGGISGPGTYGVGSNTVQEVKNVESAPVDDSNRKGTKSAVPVPVPVPVTPPEEQPTATPEPTATAQPTPIPEPTQEPTPIPEPTQEPTPIPEPTQEPTPIPEPTQEPTLIPEPTPVPQPTSEPTAAPEAQGEQPETLQQSLRVAPQDIVDLGNASRPDLPQVTFFGEADDDSLTMRLWPVILMALGIAMELIALGLFLKEKEADKRRF